MIIFHDDCIHKIMRYLNKNYPRVNKVYLCILEGYDSVEGPTGEKGFAVFDTITNRIYVPSEVPEELKDESNEILVSSIAHEYMRFLQKCDGKPYDEDEAEQFAEKVSKEFFSSGITGEDIWI